MSNNLDNFPAGFWTAIKYNYSAGSEYSDLLLIIARLNIEFDKPQFSELMRLPETLGYGIGFKWRDKWHMFKVDPWQNNDQELESFIAEIKLTYG